MRRLALVLWLGFGAGLAHAQAPDTDDAGGGAADVPGEPDGARVAPDGGPGPDGGEPDEDPPGEPGEPDELEGPTRLPPLPVSAPDEDLDTLIVPAPVEPSPRTPERDIRKLLRPEASILQARNRLDRDLMEKGARLQALRGLELRVWRDLVGRSARFAEDSATLELERRRVRVRLAALGRSAATPMLSDLAQTASWSDHETRRSARAVLREADRRRVVTYRDALNRWRAQRDDLVRRTENLARTRQTIAYLEQELTWDKAERTALEAAVVREPEFYAAYAQEIEQLDEVVKKKIEELAREVPADRRRMYFEETMGGLAAPVRNSEIVGRFGTRGYKGILSKWRGVHFVPLRPPREGKAEVRAVYWGWVAWTGWMQGLGQVVILDHTMGYWSLYGHLSKIEISVGEKVRSGQTLGYIGDTESFFGDRAYLELRKDGVAIDPVPWLK